MQRILSHGIFDRQSASPFTTVHCRVTPLERDSASAGTDDDDDDDETTMNNRYISVTKSRRIEEM